MSGLFHGQLIDYLIVGLVCTVAGGIVLEVVKDKVSSPWRRIIFALVFAIVGVIGHLVLIQQPKKDDEIPLLPKDHSSPTPLERHTQAIPSPTTTPAQPKQTFEEVFIRDHVASPAKNTRKAGQWAVLITEPGSQENYPRLATAVASMIAEAGHSTVAIFRPSATHGAGFDALFAADPALSRRLNEYCDEILLGKITSSVKENPDYLGLHSLTLTVDVKTISTKTGDVQHQFQASSIGAGYDIGEARTNAEESLAANLRSELHNVIK